MRSNLVYRQFSAAVVQYLTFPSCIHVNTNAHTSTGHPNRKFPQTKHALRRNCKIKAAKEIVRDMTGKS